MSYKYFVDSEDVLSQIPASPQPKIISQINNTGNVNTGSIDTGSILSWEENNNINLDIVPLCENKLKPVKVIEMDKVVKNCTENKKEWRTLDGLWWVVPEYVVANNDVWIVLYDNNKKTDPN